MIVLDGEQRRKAILAQLQTTPASDLPKSQYLYQQLVSLNPDVPEYANKLKTFSERLKQQQEKERLARLRRQELEKQRENEPKKPDNGNDNDYSPS